MTDATIKQPLQQSSNSSRNNQNDNNNSNSGSNNVSTVAVVYDIEAQRVIANPMPENNNNTINGNRYLKERFPITQVLTNIAFTLITGLAAEGILRLIGPYKRGFFCDDDSIRLPYKTPTVPVWMLLIYAITLPILSFSFGEYFRLTSPKTASEQISKYEANEPLKVRLMIRGVFFYGYFLIALVATLIFTSMAKFPVGRLRPHFIDLCKPSVNNSTEFCTTAGYQHKYVDVDEYVCTHGSASQIAEARLSFFSGHSSIAMCTAIFVSIYLHCRLGSLLRYVVLVPLLQIAIMSSAMLIAYSRIQDHMHHWSDVLIGMTTGSSVSAFVAFNIVGLTLKPHRRRLGQFIPVENDNDEKTVSNNSTIETEGRAANEC